MNVYNNSEINDVKLNGTPRYYQNVSGMPFLQRPGGKDSRQLFFNIKEVIDIEFEVVDDGGFFFGTQTVTHNLGIAPYIIADITFNGSPIPMPYVVSTGDLYVTFSKINNRTIELVAFLTAAGTIKGKLYLLKLNIE